MVPLEQVVVRAQTGDRDAFNDLVRRFQDMAVGYAFSVIGDFHLAEDAAQEAFVSAWLEMPRLREPAAFAGWMRRLVFTRSTRFTRRDRHDVNIDAVVGSPTLTVEMDERNDEVIRVLAALPEEERIAATMFYFGHHSHDDIARFLGLTVTTVNNRLRGARKRMKEGIVAMAEERFDGERPSRNKDFEDRVHQLTQPKSMATDHYVYGVEALDGRDAWALFCASAAGDIVRVKALLNQDPRLVNAQHWYQFPIHMAVREGHADVVQLLLEHGADPGQSRFLYDSWDKMLRVAEERGQGAVKGLLEAAMTERFGYDPDFERLGDAIKGRDANRVSSIVASDPHLVFASDALGNGSIHWAALTRQLALIDVFLESGADIDARRADGQTPLLLSFNGSYGYRWRRDLSGDAIRNPWIVSGYLLARGATYDFCTACALGDVERIESMLEEDPSIANRLNAHNQSPLFYAAKHGRLSAVKVLLERGADPNLPEDLAPQGHALFAASEGNHIEIAQLLLNAGADPNQSSDSSGSCITIVEAKYPDSCEPMQNLLREHGAFMPVWNMTADEIKEGLRAQKRELIAQTKSDGPSGSELVFTHEILGHEDPEIFDLFIEIFGDRLKEIAPSSIYGGNVPPPEQTQKLIDHGLDVNRPNWIGKTFLHSCARAGKVETARVLIENGADVDAVELEHGGTTLAEAVRRGQPEMVKFLIEQGADPDAPEGSTWGTPRAVAERREDREMLNLLS